METKELTLFHTEINESNKSYKVIMWNSMIPVTYPIFILDQVFHKTIDEIKNLIMLIEEHGSTAVFYGEKEEAYAKVDEVFRYNELFHCPLSVTVEIEEDL